MTSILRRSAVLTHVHTYLSAHHLFATSFPIEQEAHPPVQIRRIGLFIVQDFGLALVAVVWSNANNNSRGAPPYPSAYTRCQRLLGFPLGDLSSLALRPDKWVHTEVRPCITFGNTITLQFPDRMFSLPHLALINAKLA